MAAVLRINPKPRLPQNPRIPLLHNPFTTPSAAAPAATSAPPPNTSTVATKPLSSLLSAFKSHSKSTHPTATAAKPLSSLFSAVKSRSKRSHPIATTSNAVTEVFKSALFSERDPDRLAALFQSTADEKRFLFHPFLYSLTVNKLIRARRPDLIDSLLSHSLSHPHAPHSDCFLARIITAYSTADMLDKSVSTFNSAVANNRHIAELSFSALLFAYSKAGQFDNAVEAFHRIPKELNITPGIVPHNIILKVLCKKGDVAAARKLLDEMSGDDSAKPNIDSYTTVLAGYLMKEEEAGFNEIVEEIDNKGLSHTCYTCNCRIKAFCRKGQMVKAEELLDEMVVKGMPLNGTSFKNIILGYDKVDDIESALRVFEKMQQTKKTDNMKALKPHSHTYEILIKGLVRKGELGDALKLCEEHLATKLFPRLGAVKELVKALRDNSKFDEANGIEEKMLAVLKGRGDDSSEKVDNEISLLDDMSAEEN